MKRGSPIFLVLPILIIAVLGIVFASNLTNIPTNNQTSSNVQLEILNQVVISHSDTIYPAMRVKVVKSEWKFMVEGNIYVVHSTLAASALIPGDRFEAECSGEKSHAYGFYCMPVSAVTPIAPQ